MLKDQKNILRHRMKDLRAELFKQHPDAGARVADLFFTLGLSLSDQTIVGGYWPIGSELDVRPLLLKLIDQNFKCALPCITPEGLVFRLWTPSSPLQKGCFHVFEPLPHASLVIPTLLIVPLLAFDCEGHRLGYGQGHYDRYLHQHKVQAIGIGFRGQEVKKIPRQTHDFALDGVLTEEGGGLLGEKF